MNEAALATHPNNAWNRNSSRGFWLSVAIPLVLVLVTNAVLALSGINENDPGYEAVPWNPPGWVIGAIWCVIYPMWGAARWYAYQTGLAGRGASFWVVALIVWGLLYPFVTAGPSIVFSAWANAASLALGLFAAWRVWPISKRAFGLIVPSIIWLCVATALGFTALSYA